MTVQQSWDFVGKSHLQISDAIHDVLFSPIHFIVSTLERHGCGHDLLASRSDPRD